ncbi:unnamed protein product [Paramecium octaurelia]|uniref:WD40-repeat-containing domain n=1 Tax=Paramecium octaurelia TaxID=43137 RepID=A0A8S1VTD6_PAROT|nr:unnamed protein product [Paramecium octaurelia]
MNQYIKPFKYEEIQQKSKIEIAGVCNAISFNKDSTILLVGLESGYIIQYTFKLGELKLISQCFSQPSLQRFIVMTKSNYYFSQNGKLDLTIWTLISINNHKAQSQIRKLKANIILFNQQEDLMITGDHKGEINFIKKQMLSWNVVDTVKISCQLIFLSFNYSENSIIAKIGIGKIVILQKISKDGHENWIIFQQIKSQEMLDNMLFINDSMIAVQILGSRNWQLYKLGKDQKEYTLKKTIEIPALNEDLIYIFKKFYQSEFDISNQNIDFLHLKFGFGKLYLAVQYNEEFNSKLKVGYFDSFNKTGEYVSYFDSSSKQVKIAQYKPLYWEYKMTKRQVMQDEDPLQIIAINTEQLILIGSINKSIKVYSFQNQTFKLIQQLDDHLGLIHCLEFNTKNNTFVSGSQDKTLRIWEWDMNFQKYICSKILEGFVEFQCVCFNIDENQMISGGQNQVSFWRFQDTNWSNYQILDLDTDHIQGLSLSPSQQRLLICLKNQKIVILQQINTNNQIIWKVLNKINLNMQGHSIFFNNDNLIAFQENRKPQILIFQLQSEENKIDQKTQLIFNQDDDFSSIQSPFIYNENKKNFLVKINCYIFIITTSENQYLSLYQKIQFSNCEVQGVLSKDGKLYISWNYKEKEFQIRQFKSYQNQPT